MKKAFIFLVSLFLILAFKNKTQALELKHFDIHGFISQGYLKTDKNNYLAETENGTFQFNEMGINFSANPTDRLHIGVQIFARDLGKISNDEVVLDWAFADYRLKNWLGMRMGKIKIDYGLYNETREMDMLRTSVMLPQSVYPELWRNSFSTIKGYALYGYLPLGAMGRLAFDGQIGAMGFEREGGFSRSIAPMIGENLYFTELDADYALFGTLRWNTPLAGLKTKITYHDIEGLRTHGHMTGNWWDGNTTDFLVSHEFTEKDGYVLSLEYAWKNLVLVAEYARDNFQVIMEFEGEFPSPWQGEEPPPQGGGEGEEPPPPPWPQPGPLVELKSEGWYISGSYRFTDWFELGVSYSEYYPNLDDRHGYEFTKRTGYEGYEFIAWLKTITMSASFDINDFWVLKLEASYNDGFGGVNLQYDVEGPDRYWYLSAAKVSFSF